MSRPRRIIVPGMPHHFTQRGNRGVRTFFDDDDHQQYLVWLAEYGEKYGLKIWAYCLMPNHVHVVAVPERSEAPQAVFRALQMRHAQRVNGRDGQIGHLWQGRYFSCVLDEAHLDAAVRYVERNPVRAGLADAAHDFNWSSAQPHCGVRGDPLVASDLPLVGLVTDWARWLSDPEDEATLERLRMSTHKGLPCGSDAFQHEIEERLGLSLERQRPGRPRKTRV
jgi:putative transposase